MVTRIVSIILSEYRMNISPQVCPACLRIKLGISHILQAFKHLNRLENVMLQLNP